MRIITLLFLGILLGIAGFYWYIDQKVKTHILARNHPSVAGIYSRPFEIYSGKVFDSNLLKTALTERHYLKSDRRPAKPGEYYEQDGLFEIYLRETYHPVFGKQIAGPLVYNSQKGLIDSPDPNQRERFILEPVLLSPLGTRSIKATNYQALNSYPKFLPELLLAAEDQRFYKHFGIDLLGIARATFVNLKALKLVQGGSTLTQQLAKNLLLTPKRTLGRKIMEATAAISIEQRLSKSEILELYLNEVYLGQEGAVAIHGFSEATKTFFKKEIEDLSISEAALLVGIIRAPSYYNPRNNLKRALLMKNTVLQQAKELDYITEAQYQIARNEKIKIVAEPKYRRSAPFFESALMRELSDNLNQEALLLSGARIFTGLDSFMQRCGQAAIDKMLPIILKERPNLQKLPQGGLEVGLVAIEPRSGLIRSYVGGKNYSKNQFDHVSQAQRQIGSTVKPFIYVTAMDPAAHSYKIATPVSIIKDAPFEISQPGQPVWRPANYDRKFRGDVTLRYAMERSLNVPAAYVATRIGLDILAGALERFKLNQKILPVPAISLGAVETSLLRLTAAYAALANGGVYTEPRLYFTVIDQSETILASSSISEHRVTSEDAAYLVTDMLQGVIERGTGATVRKMGYQGTAAGKTGTSNDLRDSWFIGYTPDLAVGVWLGNDGNKSIGLTGGGGAARIWGQFMTCAYPALDKNNFLPGPNIVAIDVDRNTGKRVSPECPSYSGTVREIFIKGTEPESLCASRYRDEKDTFDSKPSDQRQMPDTKKRRGNFWERLFGG